MKHLFWNPFIYHLYVILYKHRLYVTILGTVSNNVVDFNDVFVYSSSGKIDVFLFN